MEKVDIDKFVCSLRKRFGEIKGVAIKLDDCLRDQGLKYYDTPDGGRLGEFKKGKPKKNRAADWSEDERISEKIITTIHLYYGEPLEDEAKEMIAWLEKKREQKPAISYDALREGIGHFGITQYQIDNWLKKYVDVEKQGEQKPTDKIEPKFKVGDWIITNKNHIWYVYETPETTSYLYRLINQNGKVEVAEFEIVDKKARLWTIQDAKDGDVLTTDTWTFIFKKYQDKSVCYHCAASAFNEFSINNTGEFDSNYVHPATKEQHDLLLQKMHEVGYEWDTEKKELRKIKQNPAEWSEEDEQYLEDTLNLLEGHRSKNTYGDLVEWLKSLRFQFTWKPSEEHFQGLRRAINKADEGSDAWRDLKDLYEQLKAL